MNWIDYVALVVYFSGMIAIGLWSMQHVKGPEDYFMGGRGFSHSDWRDIAGLPRDVDTP